MARAAAGAGLDGGSAGAQGSLSSH
jgi:hypothetical protein